MHRVLRLRAARPAGVMAILGDPLTPPERQLAIETVSIAADTAVGALHAVARDHHRHMIGAAGGARRPYRVGIARSSGEFGVAARLARRDTAQLLPDRLLERGALHIERQILVAL